jgi:hypothetical protein
MMGKFVHYTLYLWKQHNGEWAKGLDFAFQGIQLAKDYRPDLELSFASIIGLAYQKQKNYKKILEWTLKPLHSKPLSGGLKQGNADIVFQVWSCAMVSSFGFMETGFIDSAFYYVNLSLEAAKSLPPSMTGYSYGTLASVYLKDTQFDSSRVIFNVQKRLWKILATDSPCRNSTVIWQSCIQYRKKKTQSTNTHLLPMKKLARSTTHL